jgi:hypothetical protein
VREDQVKINHGFEGWARLTGLDNKHAVVGVLTNNLY